MHQSSFPRCQIGLFLTLFKGTAIDGKCVCRACNSQKGNVLSMPYKVLELFLQNKALESNQRVHWVKDSLT